jgi:uncharacterized protein
MRKLLQVGSFLLLGALAAFSVDFAGLKPEGHVSDFARVLDPASRQALERYCVLMEDQTGVEIAVVTLQTLAGEPIEDVANDMFRKWGVGKKGKDEGVMLLLVTGDRRMRLEVGYGLEPILPDGFAGSVLRSMRPALRGQRYGEALAEALQVLGSRIAEAKGVRLGTDTAVPRRSRPRPEPVPWPLLLGGLAILLWALGASGGRRRRRGSGMDLLLAMIAGNLIGRSIGRGGGGFGGFDSGGGFGGFGGGDSGGGGASSSW